MQHAPARSTSHLAARAKSPFAALRAGLVAGCLALIGYAAPADAQSTATRTITNTAEVGYELADTGRHHRIQAAAPLIVTYPPVSARLRVMKLSCGRCGTDLTLVVPTGEYSQTGRADGPFVPLPDPQNNSDFQGPKGPIDLAAPLPLVQLESLRQGIAMFIVLESEGMNRNPRTADTAAVTLRDDVTGDTEVLRLVETGPDTGVFAAAIDSADEPARNGDGRMTSVEFSRVVATFVDPYYPENRHSAEVFIGPFDPLGVVFDLATGAPVSGVRMTLIDTTTNAPATLFGDDLVSPFPATIVTGSTVEDASGRIYRFGPGEYRFPMVRPGRYRMEVVPPEGYVLAPPPQTLVNVLSFSSRDGVASMELGQQSDVQEVLSVGTGSYEDDFMVAAGSPVRINVPLARAAVVGLTRQASRDTAEAGDFVGYTVTLTTTAANTFSLTDTLPGSVRLVPGSVQVDGAPAAPVMAADGRSFSLPGLTLAAGGRATLRYTAQVTATAATAGSLVTQSAALAGGVQVAAASHSLRLADAFDLDRVAILGQVVAGACGAAPDAGRDLSGIRIYMEDGSYAVTDAAGRFSFRDIARKTRVLQLDELTLPRNARPVLCDNNTRRAGSAISQFVELRPGLMGRANFHIVFDGAEDAAAAVAEATRPSAWRVAPTPRPEAIFTAEWLNRQPLDAGPRILFPSADFAPTSSAIDVYYLRGSGLTPEIMVNGRNVDSTRRDPAIGNLLGTLYLDRWRAVRIEEGRNTITLVLRDAQGQEVFRQTRTLHLSGAPAFMDVIEETSVLESDGRSAPIVELRVTDRDGVPLRAGAQVSVRVAEPFGFAADDIRPGAPAHERGPQSVAQATVGADGVIRLTLAPVLETGTARFEISTGGRTITRAVRISAAERPWVLVGLAEGTLDAGRVRRTGLPGGDIRDPASGRVAFFAEGVIKGEWLLTLRYDSDARLADGFSGIDPDKDYLVYGDASRQGNAAESRFPLYVRLRKEDAEFLIGDFRAEVDTGLVSFNRRMTGARALLDGDDYRVLAFAAQPDAVNFEDRIALDGTIGPFALSSADLVQHSEVVRLVVSSRFDASEVLETRVLVPGVDYTLDRERGAVMLRRPIPAFTPEFDRNSLVVSYQVSGAVQAGRVLGLRAERDLDDSLTMGLSVLDGTRVNGADADARLIGADVSWRPNDDLTLSAEVVQVEKSLATGRFTGHQAELRAEYDDGLNRLSAYARRQKGNTAFNASSAAVDSDIFGMDFSLGLPDAGHDAETGAPVGLFLEGRAVRERDRIADSLRHDAQALLVNRRADGVEHGFGARAILRDDAAGRAEAYKLLSRAAWVSDDGRLSLTLGAEATVAQRGPALAEGDHVTLEAAYDFSDTLRGFGTLSADPRGGAGSVATFGLVAQPFEQGSITAGLTRAARGGAAGFTLFLGMTQDFAVSEEVRFSLGMDAQRNLGGAVPVGLGIGAPVTTETFVTLRAGIERRTETWSASLLAEARRGETDRKANLQFSADTTLGQDWTLSASAFAGETRRAAAAPRREADLRLSAAHRTGAEDPITLFQAELSASEDAAGQEAKAYAAVYHARYLSAQQTLNTRYGVKYTESRGTGGAHSDLMQFAGVEYRHDLTDELDLGVHGALMHSSQAGTVGSFGLSVGVTPFENGWISVGYNFTGFRDADFSALGYTDKGAFIQFRFKFDQHTLGAALARQFGAGQ